MMAKRYRGNAIKIDAITPPDRPSSPSITPPEKTASIRNITKGTKNTPSSSLPSNGIAILEMPSFAVEPKSRYKAYKQHRMQSSSMYTTCYLW